MEDIKEKTADERMLQGGLRKVMEDENLIKYTRGLNELIFYRATQSVHSNTSITMPLLQAINKKCKELGWI